MTLTTRGICHDLSESPYTFTRIKDGNEIIYCFSSRLHLEKFKNRERKHNDSFTEFLKRKYRANFDILLFSDLGLYRKIESRGFYIKINNKGVTCLNSLILNGDLKMKEKPEGLSEISTTNFAEK